MTGIGKIWDRVKNFKLNIMNYGVFLQICAVALILIHLTLLTVMAICGQTFLSRLNIVSVLIYLAAFRYAGQNRVRLVYFRFVA